MQHRMKSYVEDFKTIEYCTECGCERPALTSECPGEYIDVEKQRKVAGGEIDYVGGQWRQKKTGTSST